MFDVRNSESLRCPITVMPWITAFPSDASHITISPGMGMPSTPNVSVISLIASIARLIDDDNA